MVIPRVGLSPRRKLPIIYVWSVDVLPQNCLRFLWRSREWKLKDRQGLVECWHLGDRFFLSQSHAFDAVYKWGSWLKSYLPYRSIEGMTVLDVGGGCGETAHFFLKAGASRVIAIESDPRYARILRENASTNQWNVDTICEPFHLNHLRRFDFDFMKMDIDGGEFCLFDLDSLPPTVVETHDPKLASRLAEKFDMRTVEENQGSAILTNIPRVQE